MSWNLERAFGRLLTEARRSVHSALESALEEGLAKRFTRAELEVPCAQVLRHLYRGARVEATGGAGEQGADIVVTWEDPISETSTEGESRLSWRLVVQVKDWRGTATEVKAIEQVAKAVKYYGREDVEVRGAVLMTLCDDESKEFRAYRQKKSEDLKLTIDFVTRKRLLGLMRDYAIAGLGDSAVESE